MGSFHVIANTFHHPGNVSNSLLMSARGSEGGDNDKAVDEASCTHVLAELCAQQAVRLADLEHELIKVQESDGRLEQEVVQVHYTFGRLGNWALVDSDPSACQCRILVVVFAKRNPHS